jgi:hypothetical protein
MLSIFLIRIIGTLCLGMNNSCEGTYLREKIFLYLQLLSNGKGGGMRVVSIDRPLNTHQLIISADFIKLFKGPWPFKQQNTFLSG